MRLETACLRTASRLCGAVLAAWMLFSSGLARAQTDAEIETARALFIEASTLAEQGRFQDARERYLLSLRLRRAAITFYSLGVVDRELGRLVEARDSFQAFLAEPSAPATQAYEEPARQAIAVIESSLAVARLEDANKPPLAEPTPVAVPTPAPLALAAAPDHTLPFTLIGAGSALFVAGLTTGLVGLAQAGNTTSPTDSVAESARTKGFVGDILAGAGLAAAGAGVIVLLLQKSPSPAKASSVRPWIAGTSAGVWIRF